MMTTINDYTPVSPTPNDISDKPPAHYVLRHFLQSDHIDSPECPCSPYVEAVGASFVVIHNKIAFVDPNAPLCSPTE